MSKLNIYDLCSVLTSKNGLDDKESHRFIKAIFDVIQEGLDEDKIVKVKGLGTFKIIEVDDRESINVNTGERVLIEGHSKLTFTPDSVMKEIVNKPFSQFETVILNEGVDFPEPVVEEPAAEDIIADEPAEGKEIIVEPQIDNKVAEQSVEEEPVAEKTVAEEPVAEEPVAEEPVAEEPVAEEPVAEDSVVEFTDDNDNVQSGEENSVEESVFETSNNNSILRWILSGIAVLLLILGAAYGGYLYGRYELSEEIAYKQMKADLKTAEITTKKAQVAIKKDSVAQEVDATKIGAMSIDNKDESANDEAKTETAKTSSDKYEAMDIRVRTGAYRIIGEDRTVKAKAGQTVEDMATKLLGPGMSCYVEVYNGLDGKTTLKEGQTIKIPKLELKKRR
ncbi:MAG: HU family DNA-binding protein [Prevotellaceae bacterium]|nr:HU family DNA-binding protein [Prevotellaceae bacterium]MDY5210222.1 HU family DNA-binding protein [Prevotella sp.]